ncbi:MAG: ferritin [Planctomycetes bacterium]|nr:ferritin [Planctomycetota bacterium]
MALSKTVQTALNDQIGREFYSAYLYLSMSAYCGSRNLPGFAHWMMLQAKEEAGHAMKIYGFIEDRSGRVMLQAIDKPPSDFKSPLELVTKVRQHEEMVTEELNKLYALAASEHDYATQIFLEWFLTEQVEEEKSSSQLVERVKMVGDNQGALLLIDRELGARSAAS